MKAPLPQPRRRRRPILRRMFRWVLSALALVILGLVLGLVAFSCQATRRESHTGAEAAPSSGRFVRGGDVDMFVQEMGPSTGASVLFVHGTGAWSETWRESMTVLAAAGFHAIAIDLPPFGYSERPAGDRYGPGEQGQRILGVLDALGIRRAVLVGHSFGGGPTMEAAFRAPDRLRALVLADVALGLGPDAAEPTRPSLPLRVFLGARPLRDAFVATFLTNPLFTRRLLGLFIADPARATDDRVSVYRRPLVVKGSTRAIGEWLPVLLAPQGQSKSREPSEYKALRVPVLVLWGEKDTITPLPQGQHLASLIPGAELNVMARVGHIPQIEDASGFNQRLVDFLTRLEEP